MASCIIAMLLATNFSAFAQPTVSTVGNIRTITITANGQTITISTIPGGCAALTAGIHLIIKNPNPA